MGALYSCTKIIQRNPWLLAAGAFFFACAYFLQPVKYHATTTAKSSWNPFATKPICLEGAEDVYVLLKTGSKEARATLSYHLKTTLACATDFGVYSDLEDTVEGIPVHNILTSWPDTVKNGVPEFQTYRAMQAAKAHADAGSALDYTSLLTHPLSEAKEDNPGWKLDKWKFFPLLRAALAHPSARWFLFIESDTNIVWSNLARWLRHLDPATDLWLGGQAYWSFHGIRLFAHGGTGFLLTRSALRKAVAALDENPELWLLRAKEDRFGDSLTGRLLQDGARIPLTKSWPLLQGETPASIDYGAHAWCWPIVSQHHMDENATRAMSAFEQAWLRNASTAAQPILHRDVFRHFVAPQIMGKQGVRRVGWDNASKDRTITAMTAAGENPHPLVRIGFSDAGACRRACEEYAECVQWTHEAGVCRLGKVVRLGNEVDVDSPRHNEIVSGWIEKRIWEFVERMEPCTPRWILKVGDSPGN